MKHVLFIAAIMFSAVVFGQTATPIQEKKAEFYAQEAISYFKLKEKHKNSIYEAKLGMLVAQKEMERKKKAGELEEADVDSYRKKNVYPFTQKLLDIIGITWKELSPFNDIVHPKMNEIK